MTGFTYFHPHGRPGVRSAIAALLGLAAISISLPALAEPIRGAGSTFAAPIINQWSRDYETLRTDGGDFTSPDWRVDYEPVGSLAGIMRLSQPDMDFAATDAPLPPEEIEQRNYAQFPIVMGGIVVVANIEGIGAGELRMTGEIIADIYLGKITRWNDPAVASLNPGTTLPDADIAVLHREDGSGSTLSFTSFLAANSTAWSDSQGANTLIQWPVGSSERGTGALAARVSATKNSIAYLEYGQVVRAGLPYASLRAADGSFIRPEPAAFQAGLTSLGWDEARGFQAEPASTADDAWPMSVITYAIVSRDRAQGRINRVLDLFSLAFAEGDDEAKALGYVPVSSDMARQIEAYWAASLGRAGGASLNN